MIEIDYFEQLIKKEFLGQENPARHLFNDSLYEKLTSLFDAFYESINLFEGDIDPPTRRKWFDAACRKYISNNPTSIEPALLIGLDKSINGWLSDVRWSEIEKKEAYAVRYLQGIVKKGRNNKQKEVLKNDCRKILGRLGDPKSTQFFKKGLVVGNVQSGKTENFNGVINYAVDSGYQLIIVLSGILESLRSQTQTRAEIDIIKGYKGSTNFLNDDNIQKIISPTSPEVDFKKTLADAEFSLDIKLLLVCKKNTAILQNILLWLASKIDEHPRYKDIPILIVDDEADNASLNNSGSKKDRITASKINGHIRAILSLFNAKSYLGYTATPFANVLQDQNKEPEGAIWEVRDKKFRLSSSLFPDDFIVLLNPPSDYIGPKRIFKTLADIKKLPILEIISDHEKEFPRKVQDGDKLRAAKKDDHFPKQLPKSLKNAIHCFLISAAIREKRKEKIIDQPIYCPHNTMLIHISLFAFWQNRTKKLIEDYVAEVSSRLTNEPINEPSGIYESMKDTWNNHYNNIVQEISDYLPSDHVDEYMGPIAFESIIHLLADLATKTDVTALNSLNGDNNLKYEKDKPQMVIAVGGNKLSRGFTLEGLTITYFTRIANTEDTLLQMGRWFGYRPGYIDCCKIFMPLDLRERFDTTTLTVEELEGEFIKMEEQRKTPKEFELKVRRHPGVLKVTRPSILKQTKQVSWSYADTLTQAIDFKLTKKSIDDGWNFFRTNIVAPYQFEKDDDKGFYKAKIDSRTDVISIINNIPNLIPQTKDTLIAFLNEAQKKKCLTDWYIGVKCKGDGRELKGTDTDLPGSVNMAIRRAPTEGRYLEDLFNYLKYTATGKNANVTTSGKDLSLTLSETEIDQAEDDFRLKKPKAKTIPERVYRERMNEQNGLLLFYLIDPETIFKSKKMSAENQLRMDNLLTSQNIDPYSTPPLVASVIAIPPLGVDIGGDYYMSDDIFNDDEIEESDSISAAQEQEYSA